MHEVADDIARRLPRHVDPNAREEGACAQHERAVDDELERVPNDVQVVAWWAEVVHEATDGCRLADYDVVLPFAEETSNVATLELLVEHCGDVVQVGGEDG